MKISTKTWCQPPKSRMKGLIVAMIALGLCGFMPQMGHAAQTHTTVEQTPVKVTLKGKIVDEAGKPLIGASVFLKNTTIGTATNKNGEFLLSVPNEQFVLVVTSVGYEKVEMKINNPTGEKELNISMKPEELSADEVLVTGMLSQKKSSYTGTYTTIKKEQLMSMSPTNMMQAISAFEPSFRIVENIEMGSDPNTMPEAYLRGQTGMSNRQLDVAETVSPYEANTNPNLPIFILDGFEISLTKFNDLDPNRIESITILKDAQATALYGSRASNGVLVITSAVPQAGKLHFSYSTTMTVTAPDLTDYHLMNAEEKLAQEIASGYYETGNWLNVYDYLRKKRNAINRGVDTYWLSIPLRTQFNHNHSLYIDGGSESFRFGLGLRYQNENGVMKGSYRDVYGAELKVEYRLPDLQITNAISINSMKSENSPYGSFDTYTKLLPYESPYDLETGEVRKQLDLKSGYSAYANPLYDVVHTENLDQSSYIELTNNLLVNWNPFKRLVVKGQFSVTKKDDETLRFKDPRSAEFDKYVYEYGPTGSIVSTQKASALEKGSLSESRKSTIDWDSKIQASYSNSWNQHVINVMTGINATGNTSDYESKSFKGFPSSKFKDPKYAYEQVGNPYYDDMIKRAFGVLLNANYSYKDIYMADFSYRLDGSSQFGSDSKFATFFSVGAGVNMHNWEYFRNNLPAITQARFRANYGQTGNVNYPPYVARDTYEILLDGWHATGMASNLVAMGNSNLTWETTHTVNIGVDVLLWNRFNLELNWYNKLTTDLITDVSLPSSAGFSSHKDNLGEIQNRGWEFKAQYKVIDTKDWGFDINVNGAHNKGTIKKISDSMREYNNRVNEAFAKTSISANTYGVAVAKPILKYEEGGSLTAIYGMPSLGISPKTGDEVFMDLYGNATYNWMADHQRIIGNSEPDLSGNFGFSVRWKDFSLYTNFLYQFGADQYNKTLVDRVENLQYMYYNCDERILQDRWHKPGDIAKFKDIADVQKATLPTSRFLMRNNYIHFNSLTLNWNCDDDWVKSIGLSRLRMSFNMSDIVKFSTIKIERGLSYPFARSFNFTLSANF